MRNFETHHNINSINLDEAAAITARAFGRENEETNYEDTVAHLSTADIIHTFNSNEQLVAYTAYRRQLWQAGN